MSGASMMARPKAKRPPLPKAQGKAQADPAPETPPRVTIINLKGSPEQADWLVSVHRKTHLSKSVIVRLALEHWAASNGHPPFPISGDDE
jgi:hypothetical protein